MHKAMQDMTSIGGANGTEGDAPGGTFDFLPGAGWTAQGAVYGQAPSGTAAAPSWQQAVDLGRGALADVAAIIAAIAQAEQAQGAAAGPSPQLQALQQQLVAIQSQRASGGATQAQLDAALANLQAQASALGQATGAVQPEAKWYERPAVVVPLGLGGLLATAAGVALALRPRRRGMAARGCRCAA